MKKKLDVCDLQLGMYIFGLDRPWLETPFIFQGFEITTEEELLQLQEYCQFVYIDTTLGRGGGHALDSGFRPLSDRDDNGKAHDRKRLEFEILKTQAQPEISEQVYQDQKTLEEELEYVRDTYLKAGKLFNAIAEDAKLGKNIDIPHTKVIVGDMAKSIIRNPDALMLFSQIKDKDKYTAQHSIRVCILALSLGRQLGLAEEALSALGIGALLHDVGKVLISDEILNKPARLTEQETELMKLHVSYGMQILRTKAPGLPSASLDVVRSHHERFDGSGYLSGTKAEEISQFGHIGAIVDYYDALTSDRLYAIADAAHTTLMTMYDYRGRAFHPKLVEQFIRCVGVYPIGSVVQLNTGEAGVVITRNRERHLRPRIIIASGANNKPYSAGRMVDMTQHRATDGRQYEIVNVLEQGEHNIKTTDYLPVYL